MPRPKTPERHPPPSPFHKQVMLPSRSAIPSAGSLAISRLGSFSPVACGLQLSLSTLSSCGYLPMLPRLDTRCGGSLPRRDSHPLLCKRLMAHRKFRKWDANMKLLSILICDHLRPFAKFAIKNVTIQLASAALAHAQRRRRARASRRCLSQSNR
jgi:hypothetical protein